MTDKDGERTHLNSHDWPWNVKWITMAMASQPETLLFAGYLMTTYYSQSKAARKTWNKRFHDDRLKFRSQDPEIHSALPSFFINVKEGQEEN